MGHHQDAAGRPWLATRRGVCRDIGLNAEPFGSDHAVFACPARVLLAQQDTLWVGTLRGLARVRDERAEEITALDGSSPGYVYSLEIDRRGRLWTVTLGRGLWRLDGSRLEAISPSPLSAAGNTYAVTQGPDGDMLVIQDSHVVRLDVGDGPTLLEERFPVAGWSALWPESDLVLIGTSRGLRLLHLGVEPYSREVSAMYEGGAWEFTNTRARDGRRRRCLLRRQRRAIPRCPAISAAFRPAPRDLPGLDRMAQRPAGNAQKSLLVAAGQVVDARACVQRLVRGRGTCVVSIPAGRVRRRLVGAAAKPGGVVQLAAAGDLQAAWPGICPVDRVQFGDHALPHPSSRSRLDRQSSCAAGAGVDPCPRCCSGPWPTCSRANAGGCWNRSLPNVPNRCGSPTGS